MIGADGLLPALHQGKPWRRTWPLGLSEHLGYDKREPITQSHGSTRRRLRRAGLSTWDDFETAFRLWSRPVTL